MNLVFEAAKNTRNFQKILKFSASSKTIAGRLYTGTAIIDYIIEQRLYTRRFYSKL